MLSKRRLKPLYDAALATAGTGCCCRVWKRSTSVCAVERNRLTRKSSSRSTAASGAYSDEGSTALDDELVLLVLTWCPYGDENMLVVCTLASARRPIASRRLSPHKNTLVALFTRSFRR